MQQLIDRLQLLQHLLILPFRQLLHLGDHGPLQLPHLAINRDKIPLELILLRFAELESAQPGRRQHRAVLHLLVSEVEVIVHLGEVA